MWLTAMGVHVVEAGTPTGMLTHEKDKAFREAIVIFVGTA